MPITAGEVVHYISTTKEITIEDFYHYITQDGTNFEYDINEENPKQYSALMAASWEGNLELVAALIAMGANVNSKTTTGFDSRTSLFLAIEGGYFDIVKLLVNNGAYLHDNYSLDPNKCRYITYALRIGQKKIAEFLIQFISPTLKLLVSNKCKYDSHFYEKSLKAEKKKSDLSLPKDVLDLIEFSLSPEERLNLQENIHDAYEAQLKKAVIENDLPALRGRLEDYKHLVPIKKIYFGSDSALRVAALRHRNLEMVKVLVEHGDLIYDRHTSGISIIEATRREGYDEIADYLENFQENQYKKLFNEAIAQKERKLGLSTKNFFEDRIITENKDLSEDESAEKCILI